MRRPPFLHLGDKVGIAASARKISQAELAPALKTLSEAGLEVHFNDGLFAASDQFAGDDQHRVSYLQKMLDDPQIKAILFARGGYGSLRIVDQLDFSLFRQSPKWLVGYSDITILHAHLQQLGYESLHATMPINFETVQQESLLGLFEVLKGKLPLYSVENSLLNRNGEAIAEVVGGNLSTLFSLLGSETFPDTKGKILFLEDLDEYLYHIDRMILAIKRAGKLQQLAGLIIGGMTDMHDNSIPFGQTANEIIAHHTAEFSFPVCFGFPAGHQSDNRPIILGHKSHLSVQDDKVTFDQNLFE